MTPTPTVVPGDRERKPDVNSVEPQVEKAEIPEPAQGSSTDRKDDAPQLNRTETAGSWNTEHIETVRRGAARPFEPYDDYVPLPPRLPRHNRRVPQPPRRFEHSPPPQRWPADAATPLLSSSVQLIEQLNYDGLADLPYPARSSIYLSTFPFTDKDVKEWNWLFQLGIEGKFLAKQGDLRDEDGDEEDDWLYPGDRRGRIAVRSIPYHRGRRDRSPIYAYDSGVDVPSVYLSRALDTTVIPESSEKDFTFVIVVRNRGRAGSGAKLLTTGSRKAAGILIYYEALIGHSVLFVGAMKEGVEKGTKARKYMRAENLEEAALMANESVVGIIC